MTSSPISTPSRSPARTALEPEWNHFAQDTFRCLSLRQGYRILLHPAPSTLERKSRTVLLEESLFETTPEMLQLILPDIPRFERAHTFRAEMLRALLAIQAGMLRHSLPPENPLLQEPRVGVIYRLLEEERVERLMFERTGPIGADLSKTRGDLNGCLSLWTELRRLVLPSSGGALEGLKSYPVFREKWTPDNPQPWIHIRDWAADAWNAQDAQKVLEIAWCIDGSLEPEKKEEQESGGGEGRGEGKEGEQGGPKGEAQEKQSTDQSPPLEGQGSDVTTKQQGDPDNRDILDESVSPKKEEGTPSSAEPTTESGAKKNLEGEANGSADDQNLNGPEEVTGGEPSSEASTDEAKTPGSTPSDRKSPDPALPSEAPESPVTLQPPDLELHDPGAPDLEHHVLEPDDTLDKPKPNEPEQETVEPENLEQTDPSTGQGAGKPGNGQALIHEGTLEDAQADVENVELGPNAVKLETNPSLEQEVDWASTHLPGLSAPEEETPDASFLERALAGLTRKVDARAALPKLSRFAEEVSEVLRPRTKKSHRRPHMGKGTLDPTRLMRGYERLFLDRSDPERKPPIFLRLLLDHSGSMDDSGRLSEAKKVVSLLLMAADDAESSSSLLGFANRCSRLKGFEDDLTVGLTRLEALRASGGTALYPALSQTLKALLEADEEEVSLVVFISDGEISDFWECKSLLDQFRLQSRARVRFMAVLIGRFSTWERLEIETVVVQNFQVSAPHIKDALERLRDDLEDQTT